MSKIELSNSAKEFLNMEMIQDFINNNEWDEVAFYLETRLMAPDIIDICKLFNNTGMLEIFKEKVYFKAVTSLISGALQMDNFESQAEATSRSVAIMIYDDTIGKNYKYQYYYNYKDDRWVIENSDLRDGFRRDGEGWDAFLEACMFFNTPLKDKNLKGYKLGRLRF